MNLYKHQADGIELCKKGSRALYWDCGTGKTLTMLKLIEHYKSIGVGPALVVCPKSIIEPAWTEDCKRFTPELKIVSLRGKSIADRKEQLTKIADIYIVNFDLFRIDYERIIAKKFDTLIVDECFTGDTLVDTEKGQQAISTIKPGDKVWNCLGLSTVKKIKKRYIKNDFLSLTTIGGGTIISSVNHPYLTLNGWIKAGYLRKDDYVIQTTEAMRMVQEDFTNHNTKRMCGCKWKNISDKKRESFLQSILFSEMENETTGIQSKVLYKRTSKENKRSTKNVYEIRASSGISENRTNKNIEPYAQSCIKSKMFRNSTSNGTQTPDSKGQRKGVDSSSGITVQRTQKQVHSYHLGIGTCRTPTRTQRRLSDLLQNRHSCALNKTGYRGGRNVPQGNSKTTRRQEKRQKIVGIRVDGCSIYQSDNPGFDKYRDEQNRVVLYDLEIEGHPSFSVNGILVHNSSKMKDQKTQITRALLSLAGIGFWKSKYKTNVVIPYRYVLSGTPSPNNEMGYWSQVKMITGKGNQGFCDNFYSFRGQYFNLIDVGNNQKIPKFRKYMADQFNVAMKPFCSVARKEDVLDLPPQTFEIRKVELSPDERRAYDTFKKELVLRYGDLTIVGSTILTEIMKLRQLTSSFAYTDTGIMHTGKSKLNELSDLLEEIGDSQVLIWVCFREEIRVIKELLGEQCTILSGAANDAEKKDAIIGFQNGKYKYLVANYASAAHGLTFVNCAYTIYYSLNYSYEMDKQSQERTHRIGQLRNVTYYYLIAEKTIDEIIYKVLQKKADLSNSILNFLKKPLTSDGEEVR